MIDKILPENMFGTLYQCTPYAIEHEMASSSKSKILSAAQNTICVYACMRELSVFMHITCSMYHNMAHHIMKSQTMP